MPARRACSAAAAIIVVVATLPPCARPAVAAGDAASAATRARMADIFEIIKLLLPLSTKGYQPRERYEQDERLRAAIDATASGQFSRGDAGLLRPLVDSLLSHDEYLVLADYASYVERQEQVGRTHRDLARWARLSILNTAPSGMFCSDRSIREYAEKIWRVKPMPVHAS